MTVDGWIGGGSTAVVKSSGWSGVMGIGATALYRNHWFELGVDTRTGFGFPGPVETIVAAICGVKSEPLYWLRLELLAEAGAEFVSDVGSALFSSASGDDSATLPYAGAKASASLLLGRSHRFLLGWWVNAGETLGEKTINPVIQTCFLECSSVEATYAIGGPSWSTGLRIGGDAAIW